MKKLIVGNWKMNGLRAEALSLAGALVKEPAPACDMVLCPPAALLHLVQGLISSSPIKLGGQDCHTAQKGAFTGDISAEMLKDAGCGYVIVGHSERRQYHAESSQLVAQKAKAAHDAGLTAIICVGELGSDRDTGRALSVVGGQIENSLPPSATSANTVVAYEPVWAIGTGKVASIADVAEMHGFIRQLLQKKLAQGDAMRILYGGSVKPDNAGEILKTPNVNGVLVGGASLKAVDFIAIATA